MKIAFDISQTGAGKAGCGFYAAALIDGLLARDASHQYTLLTSFGDFFFDPDLTGLNPNADRAVAFGPRHRRRRDALAFWGDQSKFLDFLNSFDIVHANNFWAPNVPIRPSLIYTVYDLSFAEHPEWTTEANRLGCFSGLFQAALHAQWFVAISKSSREAFLHHFPQVAPDRVRVIYPASRFNQPGFITTPSPPAAPICQQGDDFFLSVGTLEPRKNQHFLIDVYGEYRRRGGAAIPLLLAGGPGWLMQDFDQKLRSSPWAADIHLLGYVSDAELAWLYQNCLANLYPSLYEGFGLPVLEGMAMGAPVVCSNRTSMPEIVGEAGMTLAPDDDQAWVEALELMTTDGLRRQKLAAEARSRAEQFNWERSSQDLLDLYQEAAKVAKG